MLDFKTCGVCKASLPLPNAFYCMPKGFSYDCRQCRIKVTIKNKLIRKDRPHVKNENKQDSNLGFIIRCTVADMVDQLESKNKVVSILPKEIHLDHLQPDYIATVKIQVRKKTRE